MEKIAIIIFILIIGTLVYNVSYFGSQNIDELLNYKNTEKDLQLKNHILGIKDIDKDIRLEHYGCFNDLYEKFFLRKINPFNTRKDFDSGITITNKNLKNDFTKMLELVKANGFNDFAINFENNYSSNYSKTPLQQLAALGLFAGYSYLSICKFDTDTIYEIYFTYSPPLERHITTDQNFNKYLSPPDLPKDACGFTCTDGSKYKCGSIGYPGIKSRSIYSVYKILELI
jgi:hypothetical protein